MATHAHDKVFIAARGNRKVRFEMRHGNGADVVCGLDFRCGRPDVTKQSTTSGEETEASYQRDCEGPGGAEIVLTAAAWGRGEVTGFSLMVARAGGLRAATSRAPSMSSLHHRTLTSVCSITLRM